MKRFILYFLLLAVAGLPSTVYAQSSGDVEQFTMPKKDGKQGDKVVDGQLLFYDMGGPSGNTVSTYAGYTRFLSATEGNQIRISFDEFDLGGNASVYVYDGDITFTGYWSEIPEGYLAKFDKNNSGKGQSVESASGSLSVLYHCKGSGSGTGWEALVESFSPKDQEWKSVSADQENLGTAYPGKTAMPLIRVDALTDGSGNPLSVTSLSFSLSGSIDIDKISNLRCIYAKGSRTPEGVVFGTPIAAGQSAVTFTGDQPLRGGDNFFYLVADIAADAPAGATIDATLTGMTAGGSEKVASAISPEGNVTLANMVLLSSTPRTYSVGNSPISLYDDGGPDGDISEQFQGSATFVPSTPGKKVAIRFTKIDLFNTSSTGMNDVLKVYAGQTADESKLLGEVLKDLVTIHSNAADGSLTITLKSTTGIPKPGFEAIVEEFTPQAMTADSFSTSRPGGLAPCAGAAGVPVLDFDVHTVNTEPALQASAFSFALTGNAPVTKATVYRNYPSKTAVGETTVAGNSFTVNLTSPVELREGDNRFSLALDFGSDAVNGQTIAAALTSATLSGTPVSVDASQGTPEGVYTVENVVYSRDGEKQTVKFSGEWRFTNTPSASSTRSFDPTQGDQITVLVPATEGKVAQLDFTKFKFMKSDYYPTVYKIFDGADTNAKVLFELTVENKDIVPEKPIRASNAQGALTVVFNAQSAGYTAYGFDAKLTEYQPQPMAVESVSCLTPSTAVILPGAENAEVLGIKVNTVGALDPLKLTALTIDMKGCQDKVRALKVFATDKEEFSTVTKVAEIVPDATKASQTVTLTEPYTLPEFSTWFWVAYDMTEPIASDLSIDASLASITIGGKNPAITDADPEGSRLTKNIYYNKEGETTVTVDGSLIFYDDGGPDGKYTPKKSGTTVFMPTEGKIIRMHVNAFRTNYNDKLRIYDGTDANGTLLAELKSSGASVTDFLAKSESGALTAVWDATTSSANDGWEILVEAFVPQPLAIASVEAVPVNDIKMLRGSENNTMVKVKVEITGDKGKLDIDRLSFSALESDFDAISAAKVYYTGTDENFTDSDLYASTTPAATMDFSGHKVFDEKGTYYFFLTYDIATGAATGAKIQAKLGNVAAGETTSEPSADQTAALTTVQEGIKGVITVGTSGDYDFATIQSAVDSLEPGIDGPVTISIADGNYRELVTIPSVKGASATNTVTLRSASGNRDKVVITYDRYTDPGSSNYDKRYGVVTLDGVDYCSLKNLTVTTGTYTGFPGVVFVRNASRHCTVDSCAVSSPTSNDNAKGTALVYMYSKNEPNCNSDYFTLSNSLLDGGHIGMYLVGTGYVALPKQRGGRVIGNRFHAQGSKSIYLSYEENAVIRDNTVTTGDAANMTSSYWALDLSEFQGDLDVSGNSVYMEAPKSGTGIYVRMYNPANCKEGKRRIYNNEINLRETSTSVEGIRVNNAIPGLEIVGNTISIEGTNTQSKGIFLGGEIKGGQITDNIIQNDGEGYAISINREDYVKDGNAPMTTNVLYAKNPGKLVYVGGTGENVGDKDFEAWKALGYDTTSVCEKTEFLSEKVLEPAAQGSLLSGTPVSFVTTDLYGAPRDAEHPTIGCYEYAESTGAPEMEEGYPTIKNVGYETAEIAFKSSLTGTLHWMVVKNGEQPPLADTLIDCEPYVDMRKGVEGSFTVDGLTPKTTYRLYAVLTSLRGISSGLIVSDEFTTTYRPTEVSTFEDVKEESENTFTDGTQSFTGFKIVDITDGVAPQPNAKAASLPEGYGVVKLTNADNLTIDGVYVKSTAEATFTAKDAALKETNSKTVPSHPEWTYVDLRDLGPLTYLEIETDGDLAIDNFAGEPQEMSVEIDWDSDTSVKSGDAIEVPAVVRGGVFPYQYIWTNQGNVEVGSSATLALTPDVSGTYFVSVTDARGTKVGGRTIVRVEGAQKKTDFNDLFLADNSYWRGYADDEDYISGGFFSGSFEFNNTYMSDWDSWAGFAYTNHASSDFASYYNDQYNSAPGGGFGGSGNYGVLFASIYYGTNAITLSNTKEGEKVPGMYITNSAWVVDAIVNGDGYEGPFEKGDYMSLRLTGIAANGDRTENEFMLADYRNEDADEHYYLDSWQWIDLTTLGDVVKIETSIFSTKSNTYGITTPTYVCIDNVGYERPVTDGEEAVVEVNDEYPTATVDLARYFSFDPETASVVYSLVEPAEAFAIDGSELKVTAKPGDHLECIVEASQKGCHEYVRIPVKVNELDGVGMIATDKVAVYPNPADDYVTVSFPGEFTTFIYSTDGALSLCRKDCNDRERIDISALPAGTYIVKTVSSISNGTATAKLIVK